MKVTVCDAATQSRRALQSPDVLTYPIAFALVKKAFRTVKATDKLVLVKAENKELLMELGKGKKETTSSFTLAAEEPVMILFGTMEQITLALEKEKADQNAKELLQELDQADQQTRTRAQQKNANRRKETQPTQQGDHDLQQESLVQGLEALCVVHFEEDEKKADVAPPSLAVNPPASPISLSLSSSPKASSISLPMPPLDVTDPPNLPSSSLPSSHSSPSHSSSSSTLLPSSPLPSLPLPSPSSPLPSLSSSDSTSSSSSSSSSSSTFPLNSSSSAGAVSSQVKATCNDDDSESFFENEWPLVDASCELARLEATYMQLSAHLTISQQEGFQMLSPAFLQLLNLCKRLLERKEEEEETPMKAQ